VPCSRKPRLTRLSPNAKFGLREHAVGALILDMSQRGSDPGPPYRKRCKRFNVPGHAHYLTFSCFQRRPFLSRDGSRQWLIEAFELARARHDLHLWAYVIMPEHAHFLIFPTRTQYDISNVLKTMKQSVSKRAIAFVTKNAPAFLAQMADIQPSGVVTYRFWQRGGGYDRNIVWSEEIWEKIDYMHNNPVERGLSTRPEEWTWSSAADYAGIRTGPLRVDFEHVLRR
jgi:putative transposase